MYLVPCRLVADALVGVVNIDWLLLLRPSPSTFWYGASVIDLIHSTRIPMELVLRHLYHGTITRTP
jgi:hypothetical protein